MFVNTQMGGLDFGFPDVCLTPTPVGPIPIPYPNMAMPMTAIPPTAAMNVLTVVMPTCYWTWPTGRHCGPCNWSKTISFRCASR